MANAAAGGLGFGAGESFSLFTPPSRPVVALDTYQFGRCGNRRLRCACYILTNRMNGYMDLAMYYFLLHVVQRHSLFPPQFSPYSLLTVSTCRSFPRVCRIMKDEFRCLTFRFNRSVALIINVRVERDAKRRDQVNKLRWSTMHTQRETKENKGQNDENDLSIVEGSRADIHSYLCE